MQRQVIRYAFECSNIPVFFLSFGKDLSVVMNRYLKKGIRQSTFSAKAGFNAKWDGIKQFFTLAKGNIRRFEHITKLKAHECLMMLEYIKEKNELEANEIKKKYKK